MTNARFTNRFTVNVYPFCGFDTDACVYKTALDLAERGIRPVVLKDYCFSENQEFHNLGLRLLERNIGLKNIK